MKQIEKVSEITAEDLADYLRIDELTDSEKNTLTTMLQAAKTYIEGYTGLTDLDSHKDFVIVVFVLVQDMYDNRALYTDGKGSVNTVVDTILGMHSVNLL